MSSAPAPTCKEQTWPYVDRACTQQVANSVPRAVRVISTDRGAPATLSAGPVVLAGQTRTAETTPLLLPETATRAEPPAPDEAVPMPKPRPAQMATRTPAEARLRSALTGPPIRAEDDEEFSDVRAYALPDGRRVTVYRRYDIPAERSVISRNDVYERRPMRFPFVSIFD